MYDEHDRVQVRHAVITVTVLAWVLLWRSSMPFPKMACLPMHHHAMHGFDLSLSTAFDWLLMLAAMMAPVLIWPLQFIRSSTFKSRRTRSTLLFVTGYTAVWFFTGISILFLAAKLESPDVQVYLAIGGTFLITLLWQCSPAKQLCLNRCHIFKALAAFGRSADSDAFLFGGRHAVWCTGSCWGWMLLPLLLPTGHFIGMMAAALLIFCERLDEPAPTRWGWRGLGRARKMVAVRIQMRLARRASV